MPSNYDNDLLWEGITHFKAKEFRAARSYLERALENADDNQTRVQANYYLSCLAEDPKEKRHFLEETIAWEPTHPEARRALAILDGRLSPEEIIDPDAVPAPAPASVRVQADRFTCPKCGGRMVYSPDGASLVCEYCSRQQKMQPGTPGDEKDFVVAMATGKAHRKPVSTQTFHCEGCGAEFILPPQESSVTCAYCGSEHIIRQSRDLAAPDAILPMAFDRRQATRYLVDWVEKKHIEPVGKVQPPRGLYLPVWAFDLMGSLPWNGYIRNKQDVPVSGEEPVSLSDICIPASHKLADLLPELFSEYSFPTAPAYDPRYLAGWPAEVYETSLSDAALEARSQAVKKIRTEAISRAGNVIDLNYSTSGISIGSFRLVLVPIWLTEIPVEERSLRVVINGLTGSVHSDAPKHGLSGFINGLLGN
jgi:predicted RNA-binding Zn-ribbon protein involved in translation (DUF1610 family)